MTSPRPQLKRILGPRDLSIFLIAALVNLNSVPVVAGIGPAALVFWIAGFFLFFIPQSIAVLELSSRYPREGGIYAWTKLAFGDFHAFLSGWSYWTNNIFYVPTLLFYIVGFASYAGGSATAGVTSDPLFMTGISLTLLWALTWINIMGLDAGKWVQGIGAAGTFLTTGIILLIGVITWHTSGMANTISASSILPVFSDWRAMALMSIVCLNYTGLELGAVIGEEIKEPRTTIPKAVFVAGAVTVFLYMVATFALQVTIPAREIGLIEGILQGVDHAAVAIGLSWIVVPVALLMSLNAAGNTSAWLAGSSRIPFVIGLDRYLPAAMARTHSKYSTPHVALVVQGIASSVFILISAIGSSVGDMYMVLLQTTIILQLIPYLYMFGALVAVAVGRKLEEGEPGYFRRRPVLLVAGLLGFAVTAAGIGAAFLPNAAVRDAWNFELKVVLGTFGFMVPAALYYRWRARENRNAAGVDVVVEVAAD
jgi:glutamate:GABA antiporter